MVNVISNLSNLSIYQILLKKINMN